MRALFGIAVVAFIVVMASGCRSAACASSSCGEPVFPETERWWK